MQEETRIAVVEVGILREAIRQILREELERHSAPSSPSEEEFKDTDQLSMTQVARYLGVCPKTVANYRDKGIIPEPEYNLSGKPRWRVAQLKEAANVRKSKLKFPTS